MTDPFSPERVAVNSAAAAERYFEQREEERRAAQAQRKRRKLGQSRAYEVAKRLRSRDQQRHARHYAERWWQALREWILRIGSEPVPRTIYGGKGAGRLRAIVGTYSRSPAQLEFVQVATPIGWISRNALQCAVASSNSTQLESVMRGRGLTTLLRDDGRFATDGKLAAIEVLRLAASLGDEAAAVHLRVLED